MRVEKIIEQIVNHGGQVLEEMVEKNETISIHKTILQLNKIFFKFAFVNTPTKQFEVVKLHKFSIEEDWQELDENLIKF